MKTQEQATITFLGAAGTDLSPEVNEYITEYSAHYANSKIIK